MIPFHVVGLDISLTSTGMATGLGWCEKTGRDGITKLPLQSKYRALNRLASDIIVLTNAEKAHLVLVEKLVFNRQDGGRGGAGERSYLYYRTMGIIADAGVPIVEVPQATLKTYALGKGSGEKNEIVDSVARRLPMFHTGGKHDMADAAVLAALGADYLGHPLADMPKAHRAAIDKLTWPEVAK
ncbi:hypothetical protein [Nonomuraea rubra]|uniref:Crossover junction endodeoxyribonuclease RuvC n=1 Tax=Nonomuraea rubra TaxID=46180 RepID=A0A7X0P8I0_9ACTN|nr:hypothetical protein [Nonomuraea rubra]MBB6557253.1 crossover junction endodeoxyribonuclease RuvC [Nonomuraea rubra]